MRNPDGITFYCKLVVCIVFDLNWTARIGGDFVDGQAKIALGKKKIGIIKFR